MKVAETEEVLMPRFITIGYGDRDGYDRTPADVRDAAHAHDQELVDRGMIAGVAGQPVQVRNTEAVGLVVEHGAFLRSDLPVAGFGLIEAETLQDAIEQVAGTPCAVAHGVVEVWPLG